MLGTASIVLPLAGATAASFGALPAAIGLLLMGLSIVYELYKSISTYRAKKQLLKDQLAAEEKISSLVQEKENLKKEMAGLEALQEESRKQRKVAISHQYQELVSQIDIEKEEIEIKTWNLLPEKGLEKFLGRIITKQAAHEELEHLKQCFELKNKKKIFSVRFSREKKEKMTFEDFLQSLQFYGLSREKKEKEQAVQMLYDILLR